MVIKVRVFWVAWAVIGLPFIFWKILDYYKHLTPEPGHYEIIFAGAVIVWGLISVGFLVLRGIYRFLASQVGKGIFRW